MIIDPHRQPGLAVLFAGLLIGGLADALMRSAPWGANAAVLSIALLGVLLFLRRRLGVRRVGLGSTLTVGLAAIAFVGRDATVLGVLDSLVLLAAFGFLASARDGLAPARSLVGDATRILGSSIHSLIGPPLLLFHDVPWTEVRPRRWLRVCAVLFRGLLLAGPILLVFTLLLTSADAVFALRVRELLDIDFLTVVSHVLWTSILAWFAAGLLRAGVLREEPAHRVPARPGWLRLGPAEILIVLALVDLLFGSFVWIQVRYLFGGASFVESATGLTYSQYARRGFFELVTIAALVLVLLLLAHWILDSGVRATARPFAVLAGLQVLLVFVMLASAYERMRLYRAEFGLTELRFYTTAFMLWLGVLLAGFLATVLRGRRDEFARLLTASALVALAGLHVADPEAQIVLANQSAPRGFDLAYAQSLGADAVPALIQVAPGLKDSDRRALAQSLLQRWGRDEEPDWRTWSASRARARRLVREAMPALRLMTAEVGTEAQ